VQLITETNWSCVFLIKIATHIKIQYCCNLNVLVSGLVWSCTFLQNCATRIENQ
jgi:hypothetical protein